MLATKESTRLLQTMSDDADSAMTAGGREHVNGAFETIERMRVAVHRDLKGLVILIAAGFTSRHGLVPLLITTECKKNPEMSFGSNISRASRAAISESLYVAAQLGGRSIGGGFGSINRSSDGTDGATSLLARI
jgi:hypothetical protein